MKVQVVRGSKQQIAETVVAIPGEIRQAVIFVEEPSDLAQEVTRGGYFRRDGALHSEGWRCGLLA